MTLAFEHIGILYHPHLAMSRVIAAEILDSIIELGASAWVSSSWDEETMADKHQTVELIIVLGGDGSMLRATRLTAHRQIPVLGINMGRLGFLPEIQLAEWHTHLPQVLRGDYWVEERLMLRAHHQRNGERVASYDALNEVVIGRGEMARVVRLETYLNDGYVTTYTADALIVATPTGSTAYALSAGGPILSPQLDNMLIIPVAPHLNLERGIIVDQRTLVRIRVDTDHTARLTVDGQTSEPLAAEDELVIEAGPDKGRFVRVAAPNYFYTSLLQRLGWSQPAR